MAGFFDDIINDPLFNLGAGLLAASGPSPTPVGFGQALGTGLQFASAAQQREQQAVAQRLRIDEARQRIQDRQRQQQLGSELATFAEMLGPQAAVAALPGAAGRLPGGAITSTLGAPPPATTPGIFSREQAEALRRLAPLAPNFVAEQIGSLLFPAPEKPTTLQRDFEFLTSIGVEPERALESLQKGTVVNVGGDAEEPLSVNDITKVRRPDGSPVPLGTTPSQARAMGAVVVTETELETSRAAENALAIVDQFEVLAVGPAGALQDVEPGILNRVWAAVDQTFSLLAQDDPNLSQLQSLSQGGLTALAKSLGAKGALSDQDIARVESLVPQVGDVTQFRLPDTREKAIGKIKQLREIFARGVRNLNRITGDDVPPPEEPPAAAGDDLTASERAELDALRRELAQ